MSTEQRFLQSRRLCVRLRECLPVPTPGSLLSILLAAFLISSPLAQADDLLDEPGAETILRIASFSHSSGFHQSATTLSGLFNWRFLVDNEYPGENHPMAVPLASPGTLTNIGDLLHGRTEMALVRADIAEAAFNNPAKLSLSDDVRHLRFVATHKPTMLHVLVSGDFPGTELADLSSHRVSVGAGEHTLHGLQQLLQIQGAPLSELKLVHAPLGESLRRLKTGGLDAVMFFDQAPSNIISDKLANGELKLLTLDKRKIEQFAKLSKQLTTRSVDASDFYSNAEAVTSLQLGSYLLTQRYVSNSTIEAILEVMNASSTRMGTPADANPVFTPYIVDNAISAIPLHPASSLLLDLYGGPMTDRTSQAGRKQVPVTAAGDTDTH